MNTVRSISLRGVLVSLGTLCSLCIAFASNAGAIASNTYLQFSFTEVGVDAAGCQPDDPGGNFCIPSSGTVTSFLDAPAWTFIAPASGATLKITDAFTSGDRFEIFDFAQSLGLTSDPIRDTDCGDDPVTCFLDPDMSHGEFQLAAGAHSITLRPVLSPGELGSGYLIVDAGDTPVSEPAALGILAIVLAFASPGRRYGTRVRSASRH